MPIKKEEEAAAAAKGKKIAFKKKWKEIEENENKYIKFQKIKKKKGKKCPTFFFSQEARVKAFYLHFCFRSLLRQ